MDRLWVYHNGFELRAMFVASSMSSKMQYYSELSLQ
jgi:hypothetical protein